MAESFRQGCQNCILRVQGYILELLFFKRGDSQAELADFRWKKMSAHEQNDILS